MICRKPQRFGQTVIEQTGCLGLKIPIPIRLNIVDIELCFRRGFRPVGDQPPALAHRRRFPLRQRTGTHHQHVVIEADVPEAHIADVPPEGADHRQGSARVEDVVELLHPDRHGDLIGQRVLKAVLKFPAQEGGGAESRKPVRRAVFVGDLRVGGQKRPPQPRQQKQQTEDRRQYLYCFFHDTAPPDLQLFVAPPINS